MVALNAGRYPSGLLAKTSAARSRGCRGRTVDWGSPLSDTAHRGSGAVAERRKVDGQGTVQKQTLPAVWTGTGNFGGEKGRTETVQKVFPALVKIVATC
jgi:hypothetical protein